MIEVSSFITTVNISRNLTFLPLHDLLQNSTDHGVLEEGVTQEEKEESVDDGMLVLSETTRGQYERVAELNKQLKFMKVVFLFLLS